jgi:hypothetical protein
MFPNSLQQTKSEIGVARMQIFSKQMINDLQKTALITRMLISGIIELIREVLQLLVSEAINLKGLILSKNVK